MWGGFRGGSGGGMDASASALDDHMLATVAIDGLITIFKKPPEEVEEAPAGSQTVPEIAVSIVAELIAVRNLGATIPEARTRVST